MTVELNKRDLIRLYMSLPVGNSYSDAEEFTSLGMARFTGNQHNENWSWNKEYFNSRSEEQLVYFYNYYKNRF